MMRPLYELIILVLQGFGTQVRSSERQSLLSYTT